MKRVVAGCLLLFGLAINRATAEPPPTSPGQATQEEVWLREFPEPERVLQDIKGKSGVDTAARQFAALHFLQVVLKTRYLADKPASSPTNEPMPAPLLAKYQQYQRAAAPSANAYGADHEFTRLLLKEYPIEEVIRSQAVGCSLEDDVLGQYFDSNWRADYVKAIATLYQRQQQQQAAALDRVRQDAQRATPAPQPEPELPRGGRPYLSAKDRELAIAIGTVGTAAGVLVVGAGMFIAVRIGKSRFNRLNQHGVEMFAGYGDMQKKKWLEGFGAMVSLALILAGGAILTIGLLALSRS